MTEPSARFQLEFIEKFQRLLESGNFVATYKYALMLALCNVAAEQGFDDDREQVVLIRDLGEQFIKLYWSHVRTYPGLSQTLRQNTGKEASILATVRRARALVHNPDRADAAEQVPENLVREATARVRSMPLWKLQTIGRQKDDPDHPDNFLYPTRAVDGTVTLRPGVSACLRRFRGLIVSMTQSAWTDYVRRHNPALGPGHDLDAFLFGADRAALHQLAPDLLDLQAGRCFYSGKPLTVDQAHVDHFIPWSKYALNTPFNLVVSSKAVNLQKSDHIAAPSHLDRWLERNSTQQDELLAIGALAADEGRTVEVARFSYAQAERLGMLSWLRGREMVGVEGWRQLLT